MRFEDLSTFSRDQKRCWLRFPPRWLWLKTHIINAREQFLFMFPLRCFGGASLFLSSRWDGFCKFLSPFEVLSLWFTLCSSWPSDTRGTWHGPKGCGSRPNWDTGARNFFSFVHLLTKRVVWGILSWPVKSEARAEVAPCLHPLKVNRRYSEVSDQSACSFAVWMFLHFKGELRFIDDAWWSLNHFRSFKPKGSWVPKFSFEVMKAAEGRVAQAKNLGDQRALSCP